MIKIWKSKNSKLLKIQKKKAPQYCGPEHTEWPRKLIQYIFCPD